jgi:hypothetical protein
MTRHIPKCHHDITRAHRHWECPTQATRPHHQSNAEPASPPRGIKRTPISSPLLRSPHAKDHWPLQVAKPRVAKAPSRTNAPEQGLPLRQAAAPNTTQVASRRRHRPCTGHRRRANNPVTATPAVPQRQKPSLSLSCAGRCCRLRRQAPATAVASATAVQRQPQLPQSTCVAVAAADYASHRRRSPKRRPTNKRASLLRNHRIRRSRARSVARSHRSPVVDVGDPPGEGRPVSAIKP